MDQNAKTLIKFGDHLFEKKRPIDQLNQEIAENFYPIRADFTASRSLGEEFASHLTTSYPLIAHRELSDSFSTMLRSGDWFSIRLAREDREDNAAKRWLEWATGVQRRAMYDRVTQFVRASKESDKDIAAFGGGIKSIELNRDATALLYRCWHPRDVAWCESYDGGIGAIHRKWEPTARALASEFRGKVHQKVVEKLDKDPYCPVKCRHIVIPSDEYDSPSSKDDYEYVKPGVRKWKTPYVSVYLDTEHEHVMEQVGTYNRIYVITRWVTVSGSQYPYSPSVVAALPDARLLQAMTLTLLEAGEKAVNPPLVAKRDVLREDLNYFAGGVSFADLEDGERIGDALQLLTNDKSGIPLGMEMREDVKKMIADAFYLNKLNLPIMTGDMTATEVSQRVQEYIRAARPLFEPMEEEDSAAVCEQTFEILLRGGAFGSAEDMPQSLRGQDIRFRFESPLREAEDKKKAQAFLEAKLLLADAVALDPGAAAMLDTRVALRAALTGAGVPAQWIRDEKQMEEIDMAMQERQQSQELLATLQQGGAVAEQIGLAGQALQGLG